MERAEIPSYADFDNYRATQRIAVVTRWIMLLTWLSFINYRADESNLLYLNIMGGALVILNSFLQWKLWQGKPITRPYVLILSLMDLTIITVGILITSRFENTFFVFYYPALLGVALIFRLRISLALVTVVAAVYAGMSFLMDPGVDTSVLFDADEKTLAVRIVGMFAIVVAANLMTRIERTGRLEAVAANTTRMEENFQLQQRVQEAEQEIQKERIRISQEIHDGAAQSAYVLSLGLETCFQMADEYSPAFRDRLQALHFQSKQALWELRYPINLGSLFEGRSLSRILKDHMANFGTIASIQSTFTLSGEEQDLSVVTKQRLFSVAHNSLANVYKYAQASKVSGQLTFGDKTLVLSINDDGVGMDINKLASSSGHGVPNMRHTAEASGGSLDISSTLGAGTTVTVTIPLEGGLA